MPKTFVTSDAWNTAIPSKNGNRPSNKQQSSDSSLNDSSAYSASSLAYSASSSAQSNESSNESSDDSPFSKINGEAIDKDGEGANYNACGGGEIEDYCGGNGNVAVKNYYNRRAQHHQQVQGKQPQQLVAQQMKNNKSKLTIPKRSVVTLDDSVDSSEDDIYGAKYAVEMEAIARSNDGTSSPKSQYQTTVFQSSPSSTKNPSISYTPPRSRSSNMNGQMAPKPNYPQNRRTSTPPGTTITPILRTNSQQSKSSSDGSYGTPSPASPPRETSTMSHNGQRLFKSSMKPPTPASNARRGAVGTNRGNGGGNDDRVSTYAEPWMCGFADAFNFDDYEFGESK